MMSLPASMGLVRPAASGGATLFDLITADSPLYWFRHGEASGSVMVNQVGTNGSYTGSPALGSTPLYTGGPTCVNFSTTGGLGALNTASAAPTIGPLTVMTICRFPTISGLRALICFDNGGSNRRWQWRLNGSSIDWVKIAGGVDTKTYAAGLVTNKVYLLACTIDGSGNINHYVYNITDHTGGVGGTSTIATVNYGGTAEFIQVQQCSGGGGIPANAYFSESCIFPTALSTARLDQYAAAAGF